MRVRESAPLGCDQWLASRYCEADAPHVDEVSELRFCAEHAGPLSWSTRLVNLYSAALRIGAYTDMPVKVPQPGVNDADWCNCQAIPGRTNYPGPWHPMGDVTCERAA